MSNTQVHGFRFHALGSSGHIRVAGVAEDKAQAFVMASVRWLRDVESRLTRFSPHSLVGRLNVSAGSTGVKPDADLLAVLNAADIAHRITQGRFDATALPLYKLWLDPERTQWPSDAELSAVRKLVNWSAVERTPERVALPLKGMELDLGGVGKEWCVDRLIERAIKSAIENCLIELGGDCRAIGAQPDREGWWVLLPGPASSILLKNEALATSGIGTRKRVLAGHSVSHLIDAQTGHPAPGVFQSVSVLGTDCLTAGIYASDCCLLERADKSLVAVRAAGEAAWCVTPSNQILADPRFLERLHPVETKAGAA